MLTSLSQKLFSDLAEAFPIDDERRVAGFSVRGEFFHVSTGDPLESWAIYMDVLAKKPLEQAKVVAVLKLMASLRGWSVFTCMNVLEGHSWHSAIIRTTHSDQDSTHYGVRLSSGDFHTVVFASELEGLARAMLKAMNGGQAR